MKSLRVWLSSVFSNSPSRTQSRGSMAMDHSELILFLLKLFIISAAKSNSFLVIFSPSTLNIISMF